MPIRGDRGRANFEVGRDEVNTGGTDYSWSRQILLTDSHIFSSSLFNELRLNYTYGRFTRNFPPGFDAMSGRNLSTELGLPSLTPGGLPEFITGGGTIGWSQSQQNENAEHSYNIASTLSWVRGRQTWKFGVDLLQQRLKTIPMFGASGGRYEFARNTTLTNSALANGTGGYGFAQFLLGVYNLTTLRDSLIPTTTSGTRRPGSSRTTGSCAATSRSTWACATRCSCHARRSTTGRGRSAPTSRRSSRWPRRSRSRPAR